MEKWILDFTNIDDLKFYVETILIRREFVSYIYKLLDSNEIPNINNEFPQYTLQWANKLIIDWKETNTITQYNFINDNIPPFSQDLMIIISLLT